MQEERIYVVPVMVVLRCDCGGEMKPTGTVLTVHPPLFPHRCEKCGHETTAKRDYPRIEYEEKK